MKVGELAKILEDEDANADIIIAADEPYLSDVLVILDEDGESAREIHLGGT